MLVVLTRRANLRKEAMNQWIPSGSAYVLSRALELAHPVRMIRTHPSLLLINDISSQGHRSEIKRPYETQLINWVNGKFPYLRTSIDLLEPDADFQVGSQRMVSGCGQ